MFKHGRVFIGLGFWLFAVLPVRAQAQLPVGVVPSPAAPSTDISYILAPNDLIQVKIFQEEDLTTQTRITQEGNVTLPLVGTIKVSGKTVEQAIIQIHDLYQKDYLVNPQVTLSVVDYAKRRFTVLGEVRSPGEYEIPDTEQNMSLLQAIAAAGGFSKIANQGRVTVKRVVGGKEVVFQLNAKAMAKDTTAKPFQVLPGDTISVAESMF